MCVQYSFNFMDPQEIKPYAQRDAASECDVCMCV
jgi:hypothetical protein